jgi:hypothetical protein
MREIPLLTIRYTGFRRQDSWQNRMKIVGHFLNGAGVIQGYWRAA